MSANSEQRFFSKVVLGAAAVLFLFVLFTIQEDKLGGYLDDATNVRLPTRMIGSDTTSLRPLTLEERVRMLELKTGAMSNWAKDPRLAFRQKSICRNATDLTEYSCAEGKGKCPGLYDHWICLEPQASIVPGDCLVYDFGIRQQPEFGKTMAGAY